jgi:8-oxo-dGTP diphosphatase
MSKIVIAIVKKDNKFLMVRRKQKEGNLHWQFPAGGVEENEADEEAVLREVFEETDVVCQIIDKLGERVHPNTNRLVSYWKCLYISGNAFLKDMEDLDCVSWMSKDEIFFNVTSEIFPAVREYINS